MSRENPQGASFTWEEISWITGIPVVLLVEIFTAGLQAKGVDVRELPPTLDGDALAVWLRGAPNLLHEVA